MTKAEIRLALEAVLEIDGQIATDPARFRRAIADVLPGDDRTANLLAFSTELGIPQVIRDGHAPEGVAHLIDHGGIDHQAAKWVVQLWIESLLPDSSPFDRMPDLLSGRAGSNHQQREEGLESPELREAPAGAYQVRIAWLSAMDLFVAISTSDGCFAALVGASGSDHPRWRRLASPDSPLSRDLFVHQAGDGHVLALWSDRSGIEAISSQRTVVESSGAALALGRVSTLVVAGSSEQIRYPIAAISTAHQLLDIFWTCDRQKLFRSSWRDGSSSGEPVVVPGSCYGNERLTILDALQLSDHRCVLAALTDRFRILVADWDLDIDVHGPWRSVAVPMDDMMTLSLVSVEGRSLLFACTKPGRLFAVDVRGTPGDSWPWWQVKLPDSLRRSEIRSISCASHEDRMWLAMSGKSGLAIVSAKLTGRRLEIEDINWILK
jgi:hypothetical protein